MVLARAIASDHDASLASRSPDWAMAAVPITAMRFFRLLKTPLKSNTGVFALSAKAPVPDAYRSATGSVRIRY